MNSMQTDVREVVPQQTSERAPRRTAQGVQTHEAILDGAVHVLTTLGLAGFSIPQVAAAVGIAPGNLTYYFPTRDHLVRAMAERLLRQYSEQVEAVCLRLGESDELDLNGFVDWLLENAVSPQTVHMFPELWAMSNQNEYVAESLDRIYEGAVSALIHALGLDPQHPVTEELRASIYLLQCVSEGSTALFGRGGRDDARFQAFKPLAKATVVDVLQRALREAKASGAAR